MRECSRLHMRAADVQDIYISNPLLQKGVPAAEHSVETLCASGETEPAAVVRNQSLRGRQRPEFLRSGRERKKQQAETTQQKPFHPLIDSAFHELFDQIRIATAAQHKEIVMGKECP